MWWKGLWCIIRIYAPVNVHLTTLHQPLKMDRRILEGSWKDRRLFQIYASTPPPGWSKVSDLHRSALLNDKLIGWDFTHGGGWFICINEIKKLAIADSLKGFNPKFSFEDVYFSLYFSTAPAPKPCRCKPSVPCKRLISGRVRCEGCFKVMRVFLVSWYTFPGCIASCLQWLPPRHRTYRGDQTPSEWLACCCCRFLIRLVPRQEAEHQPWPGAGQLSAAIMMTLSLGELFSQWA